MHINKLFKKLVKSFLLFSPLPYIPVVSISCHQIRPVHHQVDSEWTVGKGEYQSTFKFNTFDYQIIDSNLEIKASITITPSNNGYFMGEEDKFLSPMGFYWIQIFPNKTKSIEQSGFDIFQKEIWNKSIFIYVYEIPIATFISLQNEYDWFATESSPNAFFNIYLDGIHYIEFKIDIYSITNTQSFTN
ncbi:MAG: hypothetical protein K2N92_02900 [Malacoplasma sp.]|nr:hypothetical protein [Malacoplasma sp.]MDE7112524.1 hypothetical protein [Malacoplasma sp.]